MLRKLIPVLIHGLLPLTFAVGLKAAEPGNPAETKLRESLRNTMLQLRAAETERDTLKATQDQTEQEKKALAEKLETVTKQSIADKDAADKKIGGLETQVTEKDAQIGQFKEAIEKWKAAYQQLEDLARKKEDERARLAAEKIVLDRKVADREAKNLALYALGNEILSRYEKFGLGTALTAREPFTGITKVKLENLVQDYGDKLTEQKIKPEPVASSNAPAEKTAPARAKAETARKSGS